MSIGKPYKKLSERNKLFLLGIILAVMWTGMFSPLSRLVDFIVFNYTFCATDPNRCDIGVALDTVIISMLLSAIITCIFSALALKKLHKLSLIEGLVISLLTGLIFISLSLSTSLIMGSLFEKGGNLIFICWLGLLILITSRIYAGLVLKLKNN